MQEQTGTPLTHEDPNGEHPARPHTGRRRRAALVWVVALATLAADQATKLWALHTLTPGVSKPLIGDLIGLRLVRNAGAAFSSLDTATIVVTLVALLIVAGLLYYVHTRALSRVSALCLGLIAGGALGNLIDRAAREPGFLRGHVVDFIDYFGWFVGNVADIAIVVAALVLVAVSWRSERSDG